MQTTHCNQSINLQKWKSRCVFNHLFGFSIDKRKKKQKQEANKFIETLKTDALIK